MNGNTQVLTSSSRAEYIEISRVLAAYVIIISHSFGVGNSAGICSTLFLNGYVPFFFLLSGYFIRNASLESIIQRLKILVIPYLIWEFAPLITAIELNLFPSSNENGYLYYIHRGFGDFPFNFPLWFLRDLILYTALFPLINHIKSKALYLALLLLALSSASINPFSWIPCDLPGDIRGFAYFVLGIGLQQFPLEQFTTIFQKRWRGIAATALIINLAIIINYINKGFTDFSITVHLTGIAAFLALGMGINSTIPRIGHLIAKAAPATYLIFLSHYALYLVIMMSFTKTGSYNLFVQYHYILTPLIAVLIIIIATGTVAFMRKYAPSLLPYIAGIRK